MEVFGNSCLIGKDSDPEELYLFFPAECKISPEFLRVNNLYRESQLNADLDKKGFFEESGRVKAVKFRGIISSGFIIPAKSLTGVVNNYKDIIDSIGVGADFNELDGVEICKKYVPKGGSNALSAGSGKSKQDKSANRLRDLILPNQFRLHNDTLHIAKNLTHFNIDDIILISDKWHGSSCILSKVLIRRKLSWYEKFLNKLGGKIPHTEYGYIYSSGKPKSGLPKSILTQNEVETFKSNTGDYYTFNIWKRAFDDYKHTLEDGISIYSELVGFTEGGGAIQKNYDYGCGPMEYKMVVYRITYTKPDGNVIEFSWQQIKEYCKKYNLDHVKEFYFGTVRNLPGCNHGDEIVWRNSLLEFLQSYKNMEKLDANCVNKVPAEGIVVRIDGKQTYSAFKLKSKRFLAHETEELNSGELSIEDQA